MLTHFLDLAVIFRPGLISHPQHEMSPGEHALSQQVLEFLIAQQDWFMLDIPPPPTFKPELPSPGLNDDVMVAHNSEELSGGWKLVDPDRPQHELTAEPSGRPIPPFSLNLNI